MDGDAKFCCVWPIPMVLKLLVNVIANRQACLAKHNPCDFPKCQMAGDGEYAQQLRGAFDLLIKGMDDAPKGYIAEPGPINKWGKQTTKNQEFQLWRCKLGVKSVIQKDEV